MRFSDTLGHTRPLETLVQAHSSGRVHHAYLFAGPDGVGKRRIAYGFIARLVCLSPLEGSADACGQCRHCRQILRLPDWYDEEGPWGPPATEPSTPLTPLHPDVVTLVPFGAMIRIEQIRELRRMANYAPVELPWRFILIDAAETMNPPAANALLKTLEEPPAHTRFILLTASSNNLLVTIRSRCQRLDFHRLADEAVAAILRAKNPAVTEDQALRTARIAHGSARLAMKLLDDPVLNAWSPLAERVLRLDPTSPGQAVDLAGELAALGAPSTVVELLLRLLRDALLLRIGADEPMFHHDLAEAVGRFASAHSVEGIMHRIRIAEDARLISQTFNTPFQLAFERLLLELAAIDGMELSRPLLDRRDVL